MIFKSLFANDGLVNRVLSTVGIPTVDWFQNAWAARWVIVIALVWRWTGYNMVFYLAGLQNIDYSIYEAARIDGANRWKQILHVTIPGLLPTFILLLIMQIGQLLNCVFDKIYLLQNTLNLQVSEMLPTYVYKTGMISQKYGLATAGGLFNSVISVVLVLIANTISRKVSETSLF